MSKAEVRKIMHDCANANGPEQLEKIIEELNHIKSIDLTFKGVKIA